MVERYFHNEPLALIGMNCQFPGVDQDIETVEALYDMLMKGQTSIKEVPKNRWDIEEYYDADRKTADKIISKMGGFLNDPHLFDNAFFNISAAEAKQIDPQHRLFLEVAIRALNHANISLDSLNGSNTGVYCGISTHEYSQLNYKDNIKFNAYTPIGIASSAAPGRLSHFLNLKGPSMAVDTACSSSLSALYLAANALRSKLCDIAIVGGVHLNLCPEIFMGLSKANMLSAKGKCSSFDEAADGFARSEGCGVVIVKRLSDALRDNNKIYAVIKSIIMNQDGDGTGLVAPNIQAQIAMHEAVLAEADLTARDIDYIETHGTATLLGDPVEFNAIQHIHKNHHSEDKPLIIGALKSNLGHTISSSGLASLIKVAGAFQQEIIPPNLHYKTPNALIDPQSIPAHLPTQAIPFGKMKNKKRYAQVSNFSFSGTNVSLIVEEPPTTELDATKADSSAHCFAISAKSESSLKQMLKHYVDFLPKSTASLADICATLINHRDHYKFRCAILVEDKESLIKKIAADEYDIHKVIVQTTDIKTSQDAQQIYKDYLSGFNIKSATIEIPYNPINLPLYYFDRKPFWHEIRKHHDNRSWLYDLYQQSKEQQIQSIKSKIVPHIHQILNKESINEYERFSQEGFTPAALKNLSQMLQEQFHLPNIETSPQQTLDQLATHIQKTIMPDPVQRQPIIQVLNPEPIAIIGMSCRFPKAANITEFLSLLEGGECGMTDIPLERWDNDLYYDSDVDAIGRLYIKQLGLIDNVKNFDADFFNISPREAKVMSPQLRVFMETCYHALEDANLSLDSIKDSNTGVFVGCGTNEYPRLLINQGIGLEELNIYYATGNVLNALPGRIAYTFDFHGPIQAIDTACSSSMTAIHNACLSLQSGDCTMAIAGGVNILLVPESNITLSKAKMLSPESRCKTFSDDADGYARSEGCGVVVLKRLSSAIKDNDTILAVIKGTAINSDGKSGGFTVPNGIAQEEVIRSALAKADLSPADIDYIEAHGTGTPLADPIEVNTLNKIFSESHTQEKPLYISSVKTNIGHCESASGAAGLIKAVLSLQDHKLFKHLNFNKLNPAIELKNTVIPLNTMPWDKKEHLRCAGVSSFGFSGANAHIVLQQAPDKTKESRVLPSKSLLVLSAKSKTALELLLISYEHYLATTHEEFADICYTAATCRSHFSFRIAIKADTAKQAAELIKNKQYTIYDIKKNRQNSPIHALSETTLDSLQTAFQDGLIIDWLEYFQKLNVAFEKVKLPLYEFAREEHWFADKESLKEIPIPQDWCFQLQWQPQALNKSHHKVQDTHWLLIGAPSLENQFVSSGLSIVLEQNYAQEDLAGVIFAAGLDAMISDDIDATLETQKNLIKNLLKLVQTLNQQNPKLQLVVLTRNAIAELSPGAVNLSNSPLIGFCKSLALELPQYKTVLIDSDAIDCAQVVAEIKHNHGQDYEQLIAYRDNKRLTCRLKRRELAVAKRFLPSKSRYLITGGCGALGLVTAQALLSSGAKELILTSRSVDTPKIKQAIKKIQSQYPERIIRTMSVDICDKEQLRNLISSINADGLLKGIIHAAGAAIKTPLLEHQDKDVDYLFSAKVKGGWYLHELTQDLDLDFFIVYSSISSVFGSNLESVYSAANSFLDALIGQRHNLGLVGTTIQWGPWGDVGMATKRSRDHNLKQALISSEQGHALIKNLINSPLDHVALISPDFLKFMLDFVPQPLPAFYDDLNKELSTDTTISNSNLSPWLKTYLETSIGNRIEACRAMLYGICKRILELPENDILDGDEGFFEFGFDSLMITELGSALKELLEPSIKINFTIAFDYPSINKLAQYLETELAEHLINQQALPIANQTTDDSIAIIGMSCSLPNAPDIASFEKLLEEGLSGIKDIPMERWDNKKYYDPDPEAPRKSYVNQLGLIDHIKEFDAHFFGISPREAKLMEPQQRLFLECCYKALENANYHSDSLRGSLTGVYAGVGPNEYYAQLEKSGFSNVELSNYSITGNVLNLIPGRVSYTFDFKGPSISVDTACSSSLVAIHYACQSLKSRETDYALAGGVNILLMPESNITLCKAKALSPDGQCKTFDEHANGYVRAEGCGVIFLKRLSDALRDQDTILAVIKASAVNNDGKSAGLTVPNGKSQEEVMLKALDQTDLAPHDISYIEAHGTGTPLGDPIEVHAINSVYGQQRDEQSPLYLGAVKTNIGHLESASGVAGIIKTIISLRKKTIYKHLNFKTLNPKINIKDARIALENTDWQSDSKPRYAGVNAFGFSGTNAHVILQESPERITQKIKKTVKKQLLVLSAKSETALNNLVHQYQDYLQTTTDEFSDICYTAATCRAHYLYRLALSAENAAAASLHLKEGHFASSHKEHETHFDTSIKSLINEYLQGKSVDWRSYYQDCEGDFVKVTLPNYIFDKHEFWPDKKSDVITTNEIHPLLGQMFSLPANEYLFTQKLDLERLTYIQQHRVFDKVIFPGTAFIESGLAAAKAIFKSNLFSIEQFSIERPFHPKQGQEFQIQVKPKHNHCYKVNIFAKQNNNWQQFSEMEIHPLTETLPRSIDIDLLKSEFINQVDVSQIYKQAKRHSLDYGAEFQVLQEGYFQSDSILSKVALTHVSSNQGYFFHPVLLDGVMHIMNGVENTTYIPYAFSRMTTFNEAPKSIWVHLTKRPHQFQNELCVDIKLYDSNGSLIAQIDELKLRAVAASNFVSYEATQNHLYQTQWEKADLKAPHPDEVPSRLPEFLVIAKDKLKAKKTLAKLKYQFIDDFTTLTDIETKNIIFLYDHDLFTSFFHVCQSIFKSSPKHFIFVTEQAYAVKENDLVNPYHTMASSLWKSFRNELGLSTIYAIDLGANSTLVETLKYLFNGYTLENHLAVREAIFVPRIARKKLTPAPVRQKNLFNSEANYLIVGGTGGLAKSLVHYLIRNGVKHLTLTSRSECPSSIKTLIVEARQKQINIQHHQVDVSNYQQMEDLIREINQTSRPLKGLFHLAGVVHDGLIVNLTDEDLQKVLPPKVDGALILHQLTQTMLLDHFVLFSSSASLLGAKGQANYVAANGFLDGLAHLRHHQGLPALAINWGPFTLGMANHLTQGLEHHGFIPLDEESMDVLDLLLSGQFAQMAVVPMHWDTYLTHSHQQVELGHLVKKIPSPDPLFLNLLRQKNKEERIAMLSQALCEISAGVLALENKEQVTPSQGLFALGLDSLMAIEIRNNIHDKLQCPILNLSIEYFINDPSVEKIALMIAEELEIIFKEERDIKIPEPTKVAEIALCDMQYLFWVINKFDDCFNIGMQLQLHGNLNKDYLFEAFDFIVKQNSTFWMNFDKHTPVQSIRKEGYFILKYEDISLSDKINSLNAIYFDNIRTIIPLDQQPLIRVFLYKINNDLHELHFVIPHIIVDDTSCDLVLRQFQKHYEQLSLGKKLTATPEKEYYLNFVQNNNLHYEKNLDDKIRFWQEYNKDFQMLRFKECYQPPDAANQLKHLVHYPLDPQAVEQFANWHQSKNMNVSTGLIAICQIIFYKMSLQKKVPVILIHGGREGERYRSVIGLFSEYKRINIGLNEAYSFSDFINSIEEQLIQTAPYQKCSHLIRSSYFKDSGLSIGQYFILTYNKLFLSKRFKKSKLNHAIVDHYLDCLSRIGSNVKNAIFKYKVNRLFNTNLSLQKPTNLRVLLSVTPSFFIKEPPDRNFANLKYNHTNHFGCVDRPIGNQTLWVFFSKNQEGEYQLSINGPLTMEAKDLIGREFNELLRLCIKNDAVLINELI